MPGRPKIITGPDCICAPYSARVIATILPARVDAVDRSTKESAGYEIGMAIPDAHLDGLLLK